MSRRNRSKCKRTSNPRNQKKRSAGKRNKEHFRSMLDWPQPDNSIFSEIKLHGNIKWLPKYLVCLALLFRLFQICLLFKFKGANCLCCFQ